MSHEDPILEGGDPDLTPCREASPINRMFGMGWVLIVPPLLLILLGPPPQAPRRRPLDPSVGMGWVLYRPSSMT